jgi:hypothetical protein
MMLEAGTAIPDTLTIDDLPSLEHRLILSKAQKAIARGLLRGRD